MTPPACLGSCASAVCIIVCGGELDLQLVRAVTAAARGRGAIRVDLAAASEVDEAERAKIGVTDAIADGRDLVAWLEALHDALDSPRAAEEEKR